jgi:hypothetical protein
MVGMLSLCGVLLAFGSIFIGAVLPILIRGDDGHLSPIFGLLFA